VSVRRGLLPKQLALSLVRLGRRQPRLVIACAVLTWLAAGLAASRVRVDTDILSLVPTENPVVQDFKTTIERFGSVDTLLAVVRIERESELEAVLAYSELLAASLRDWELIDWVEYRIESGTDAALPLLQRATLFFDSDELDDLLARLENDALVNEMRTVQAQLLTPQSLVTKEFIRIDPMGLLPKLLARVKLGGVGVSVDSETGCIIDSERRMLLMLARPIAPAQDLEFDRRLVAGLERRVAEVESSWMDEGWQGDPPRVQFTGGYTIALDDSRLITGDAVLGIVSSLLGVMLLFLLAFRRPAALSFAALPLLTGLGLSFAFVSLALGRLNSLTAASGGLLIGLGIDFIIVLYGRYVEERRRGTSHDQAVDALGRYTGVGVVLGAVTTAATFFAFLVTDFRGLYELGMLTGTGILLLMLAVFLLLPALLSLFAGDDSSARRLHLHSFGSDVLCRASLRRPGWTMAIAVAVTVVLALGMSRLEFDDNMANLRSSNNPGSILRDEVMDAFGLRFSPMTIRIDGADEGEAFETARRMLPELERLVDGSTLASLDTIAHVIPSEEAQRDAVRRLRERIPDAAKIEQRLEAAMRSAGLNPVAFGEGIGHLTAALGITEPLALSELEGTTLQRVVDRYVVYHEWGVSTAIYCYPPAGSWRRGAPPALAALVDRYPEAVLTGPNVVSAELRRIVWSDAAKAAILGMILVFLLMWADLGSPLRSLLALLPLGVGMVWMLGAMALLGLRVNFMNIFVLTMIIGIGVDYGVHLLHRWYESGGDPEALSETAKAIAVAALTTMVGFGSLVLSHFPGLRSVGGAAILGALSTAIVSITVLPVVLSRLGVDMIERERGG
jgi:predicted RND superfamily exporter protein